LAGVQHPILPCPRALGREGKRGNKGRVPVAALGVEAAPGVSGRYARQGGRRSGGGGVTTRRPPAIGGSGGGGIPVSGDRGDRWGTSPAAPPPHPHTGGQQLPIDPRGHLHQSPAIFLCGLASDRNCPARGNSCTGPPAPCPNRASPDQPLLRDYRPSAAPADSAPAGPGAPTAAGCGWATTGDLGAP
jgi:hypothetical protein